MVFLGALLTGIGIYDRFAEYDKKAYLVGGCVRDSLLGKEPKDWDICTEALPEQVIEIFKQEKVILTGLQHGTVTVLLGGMPVEITTYRIDGEYEDGRHPKEVIFTSNLVEDLKRRDFTINAMAYNHKVGLVDEFDGADVEAAGGLDGDQKFRSLVDLTGDNGFLLVTAGHGAGYGNGALAGADIVGFHQPLGVGADIFAPQETELVHKFRLEVPLQHHIVFQGVIQHQTVLVAVLRDVAHAGQRALADGRVGDVLSAERYRSAGGLLKTRQTMDQLRLTIAVNTGNTNNFSCSNTK